MITVYVQKFRTSKKKEHPKFIFSPHHSKEREVTNFPKEGNLTASLCKIGYFPHRMIGIFLFEIKILLFEFLEHLPYRVQVQFWGIGRLYIQVKIGIKYIYSNFGNLYLFLPIYSLPYRMSPKNELDP